MPSILQYIEGTTPSPTTVMIGEMGGHGKTLHEPQPEPGTLQSHRCLQPAVSQPQPSRPTRARSVPRSSRAEREVSLRRQSARHSLIIEVPDVPIPPIPARFLKTGRPASIASLPPPPAPSPARSRPTCTPASSRAATTDHRPATSSGETASHGIAHTPLRRSRSFHEQPNFTRSTSSPTTPATADVHRADALHQLESRTTVTSSEMDRARRRDKKQDYFLEIAADHMNDHDQPRELRRSESRISHANKRRSLPPDALANLSNDRRPSTSGNIYTARPSSRFASNIGPTEFQRLLDSQRGASHRASIQLGDSASVSGLSATGGTRAISLIPDRSPVSPSRFRERLVSPDLPQYGRRRPSFGSTVSSSRQRNPAQAFSPSIAKSEVESPTEDSEPKQTDSTSNESQTADTVWDELDDLKSRIKRLELTGKMPGSSSANTPNEISDRPRTATTAPTTVDSSPKQDRKRVARERSTPSTNPIPQTQTQLAPGNAPSSDVHPTLHAALAKAKPIVNTTVFRTLEATAKDALQLAAMTGSAGPQGTTFSAASIINGATASDRHVRRKADMMCRNLTDLCLALCEGRYERPNVATRTEVLPSPSIVTSPHSEDTLVQESPSLRHVGSEVGRRTSGARAMSRLEVRRSSILGLQSTRSTDSLSPRGSIDDISNSDQENLQLHSYPEPQQRLSQVPISGRRVSHRFDERSDDEDPTIRPPSRAMTDMGSLRVRTRNIGEERSPISQRNPSLREVLAARRRQEAASEGYLETPRMASESHRRRIADQQSTPPVMEEESGTSEYYTSSQPRRRTTTSGIFGSHRRTTGEFARSPSLRQQREVIVE